ncbi:hypothetical protein GUJ93_ZPchr0002g26788 [Zizania palustris]|uniref:Uncharacterized protein n=1 Tax=Zizania palustris TaxID=103762 RepID=A0A8J5VUV9_ZIZPA|nr:hypothetical protein GUJ93_ZPchr0002g26788 [Zizania palustris]
MVFPPARLPSSPLRLLASRSTPPYLSALRSPPATSPPPPPPLPHRNFHLPAARTIPYTTPPPPPPYPTPPRRPHCTLRLPVARTVSFATLPPPPSPLSPPHRLLATTRSILGGRGPSVAAIAGDGGRIIIDSRVVTVHFGLPRTKPCRRRRWIPQVPHLGATPSQPPRHRGSQCREPPLGQPGRGRGTPLWFRPCCYLDERSYKE